MLFETHTHIRTYRFFNTLLFQSICQKIINSELPMPATSLDWVSPPRAAESLLSLIEPANDLVSYLIQYVSGTHVDVAWYIKRYMYICIYNLWYWLPWLVAVRIMRTQQDAEQINTRSQFTFILKPPVLTDDHSFSTNKTHTIIKFYIKK